MLLTLSELKMSQQNREGYRKKSLECSDYTESDAHCSRKFIPSLLTIASFLILSSHRSFLFL